MILIEQVLVILDIIAGRKLSLLLPYGCRFARRGFGRRWIEVGRIMRSDLGQRGLGRPCELPGPAGLGLMASGEELAQRLQS